jgi:proline racemase
MRWTRTLQLIDAHCEGEIGRVIIGGVLDVPGATMLDKMLHINRVDDRLRRFVVFEPRGFAQMTTNLLLAPTRPDVDAGFIVLQVDRAHPMSGSNAICVVTVLLETGMLTMSEPETVVRLDTPAGLVVATARCRDGRCEEVSLDMVPSFVQALDAAVETEGFGRVEADIAFGGCFYALVDAAQVGLAIRPGSAGDLMRAGTYLHSAFSAAVPVRHPVNPQLNEIAYVMFRERDTDGAVRTCTVLKPGRIDRSPCGTGSSANLAALHARGEVRVGETVVSRSVTGGEFRVLLRGEERLAVIPAVLPRISGRAWIYGTSQIGLDPTDPFPQGFALSDTWGPYVDELPPPLATL